MAIGIAIQELPPKHREARYSAIDILVDERFEDLAALHNDEDFAETGMAKYLPDKYLPRYTFLFAKKFLACLLRVAWRLRVRDFHLLDCVAEELALKAIITKAEVVLDLQGIEADFDYLCDTAFADLDFEMLFHLEMDGIEDTPYGRQRAMANLHFEDWFKPFRNDRPVHPYAEPQMGGSKPHR